MHPATTNLLRRQKMLIEHAKARPSDVNGIRRLREDLGRAGALWADAGYPDEPGLAPTAVVTFECVRGS